MAASVLSASTPVGRAAAALASALNAYRSLGAEQLALDEFHADALRLALQRMLELLAPADASARTALAVEEARRVERARQAIAAVSLHRLPAEQRQAFAADIAEVHARLCAAGDDAVTRGLLDGTPPGRDLAGLVFSCDPALLDPDAQVSYCQAAQRLESATHARLGAGLVAFAGSRPRHAQYWVDGEDIELTDVRASELASALAWSGGRARDAIAAARTLHNELDAAAEAAATGALQPAAVAAISEGATLLTAGIDAAIEEARADLGGAAEAGPDAADRLWELTQAREVLVQQYDGAVSAFAAGHTVAETRRKVRDTLARLDPAGFAARRARAQVVESGVEFRPLPNAMALLSAVMPAEQASACYAAIDSVARDAEHSDLQAPVGVRRSEAVYRFCVQPIAAVADATAAAERRALDAHVDLVMTLDTFLGLSEVPAQCVGAGPVPAQAARDLLAEAALVSFRRVIVDGGSGAVLQADARRYRLTDAEREYILRRDRTCRHPGCSQPARRCQVDHAQPYDDGGATRVDNLGLLCARHHLEKTHAGWTIEDSAADGSCTFVSPLGRRYPHRPEMALPWLLSGEHVGTGPEPG